MFAVSEVVRNKPAVAGAEGWVDELPERVSAGLLCAQIELQPAGRELLAAAEAVAQL